MVTLITSGLALRVSKKTNKNLYSEEQILEDEACNHGRRFTADLLMHGMAYTNNCTYTTREKICYDEYSID